MLFKQTRQLAIGSLLALVIGCAGSGKPPALAWTLDRTAPSDSVAVDEGILGLRGVTILTEKQFEDAAITLEFRLAEPGPSPAEAVLAVAAVASDNARTPLAEVRGTDAGVGSDWAVLTIPRGGTGRIELSAQPPSARW